MYREREIRHHIKSYCRERQMIAAKFGFDDTSNVKTMRKKNPPLKRYALLCENALFSKCYVLNGYKIIHSFRRIQKT